MFDQDIHGLPIKKRSELIEKKNSDIVASESM